MNLPVMPPVAPMLARPVADIPVGEYGYEPKWDGFRSIVFRDGDEVEIGSRNGRPMNRYFPEVVAAIRSGLPERCVLDGEIVVPDPSRGRLDFEALQQRIHPAESRVRLLAQRTPAHYVAFDLLALGDRDLTGEPFRERRRALEETLADARPPIHLTPATAIPSVAERWFDEFEGAGLDGIVAKPLEVTYQPDRRVMFKIKHVRTADCVVAGYRTYKADSASGRLAAARPLRRRAATSCIVGVVGAFTTARRRALFQELQPLVTTFEGHPWDWADEEATTRTPRSSEMQPVERRQGPDLRAAQARARRRGPLRPHGGGPLPSHHPVRPLAPRPGPAFVHLRPARGAGPVRPLRGPPRRARRELRDMTMEEVIDRLYGLPLAEFTSARNEAARELRKAGQRDAAERVKTLRKPTAAAGAVNTLVREHRGEVEQFLRAATALRDAQFSGKGDLAAATRQEHEALERLTRIGGETVRQTLLAAAVDDDAAQQLLEARLERELEPRGFGTLLAHAGGLSRVVPVAPPARRETRGRGALTGEADADPAQEEEARRQRSPDQAPRREGRAGSQPKPGATGPAPLGTDPEGPREGTGRSRGGPGRPRPTSRVLGRAEAEPSAPGGAPGRGPSRSARPGTSRGRPARSGQAGPPASPRAPPHRPGSTRASPWCRHLPLPRRRGCSRCTP